MFSYMPLHIASASTSALPFAADMGTDVATDLGCSESIDVTEDADELMTTEEVVDLFQSLYDANKQEQAGQPDLYLVSDQAITTPFALDHELFGPEFNASEGSRPAEQLDVGLGSGEEFDDREIRLH
jgi:hypothetical protein